MRIAPQLFAKLVALDLAGSRARQIMGNFEPPRPLVGRQRPRQPFARGRHRSRAVGARRRNDIEHDLRQPDFAFAQHSRSFADRADAEHSIPRDDGYMPAYAGPAKSDANAAVAREWPESWS
jgi:hypothetical protein